MPFAITERVQSYTGTHPPPFSLKHYFKVAKKKKKKIFQTLSFLPHPQKPKGCGKRQDPSSLHLSGNPQTALSGCARWNMPFSGLGLIFGSKGQLAPRLRSAGTKTEAPRNPSPATITDYQLFQPFLLRSTKEEILNFLGSGEIQRNDTAKKKKKRSGAWFLSLSRMWLGALTPH